MLNTNGLSEVNGWETFFCLSFMLKKVASLVPQHPPHVRKLDNFRWWDNAAEICVLVVRKEPLQRRQERRRVE